MKFVNPQIAREQVYKFIEQVNGKEVSRENFYFITILIIVNALIYIGDCIFNLSEQYKENMR